MKRILTYVLLGVLCLSLCACGSFDVDDIYEQAKHLDMELGAVVQRKIAGQELLFFFPAEPNETQNCGGMWMLDVRSGTWCNGNNIGAENADLLTRYYEAAGYSHNLSKLPNYYKTMSAALVEEVNEKLALEEFDRSKKQLPAYPYRSIDDELRLLTDEQIAALDYAPPGLLQKTISTVPDAIAYLDRRFPGIWMGMQVRNGIDENTRWLRDAHEILSGYTEENVAARSDIANCITYLLCDNYEIESLIGFRFEYREPEQAVNAIKTENGYLIFDAVLRMQGDASSRNGDLLPESTCLSVAEYVASIQNNTYLASIFQYIVKISDGERFDFKQSFGGGYFITSLSDCAEVVYHGVFPDAVSTDISIPVNPAIKVGEHVKPENIGNFYISTLLGGPTLTAEEAYALVDAEPEVVQQQVKTPADVLMYMMASKIVDGTGCYCRDIDGQVWHWNMDAKTFMEDRRGGCGQCANLGRYLLDGDFEEIGFVDHTYYPDGGGGHVYNYILHEGKYYIVDFSSYFFSNYQPSMDFIVPVLDSLEEWGSVIHQYYGNVCLSLTYKNHRGFPCVYGEDNCFYFPDTAEYTVLYDAGDGFKLKLLPFDISLYDWNAFW